MPTVTQALILAFALPIGGDLNNIFHNTAGMVFLGTPHLGSSSVNRACFCIHSILHLPIPPDLYLQHRNRSLLAEIAGNIRKMEISLMSYPVLIVLDALKIWFFLNSDLVDSNLRHLMLFK